MTPLLMRAMLCAAAAAARQPRVGVFGPFCYNLKRHTHLSIPVRPGGDPRLWPHWMFNIQTTGYQPDSLWTHRLGITGKGELGGGWEECMVRRPPRRLVCCAPAAG